MICVFFSLVSCFETLSFIFSSFVFFQQTFCSLKEKKIKLFANFFFKFHFFHFFHNFAYYYFCFFRFIFKIVYKLFCVTFTSLYIFSFLEIIFLTYSSCAPFSLSSVIMLQFSFFIFYLS